MAVNTVDAIENTVQKTHIWLDELVNRGGYNSQQQAWSALRGVLQALRDRLTPDEAAHLASNMPMLIRGLFFDGWKPSATPVKARSGQEFLGMVNARLRDNPQIDPIRACTSVFALLSNRIDPGELDDVIQMLPQEVRELWTAGDVPQRM